MSPLNLQWESHEYIPLLILWSTDFFPNLAQSIWRSVIFSSVKIWFHQTIHKEVKHTSTTCLMLMLHIQQLLGTMYHKSRFLRATEQIWSPEGIIPQHTFTGRENSPPLRGLCCATHRNMMKYFQLWSVLCLFVFNLSSPNLYEKLWSKGKQPDKGEGKGTAGSL